MIRILLLVLAFIISLSSCNNNNPKMIDSGSNLDKAIDSILLMYGGVLNTFKGFEIENGQKKDYMELSLNKSLTLNDYKFLPPSNIALILYSFLTKEAKKKV